MSEYGAWIPWAGAPENYRLSLADLTANGTMDSAVAGTLWAAAAENLSFLTVAVPRNAGKTTLASAMLALRKPATPLHFIYGEDEELAKLRERRAGGYLVVGEFSPWRMPSYIWGNSVRKVFETLGAGYTLQTSLHAPGVEAGIREVTEGCGVRDEDASRLKLVVYVEVIRGVRRVSEVFEIDEVTGGRPFGRTLFRWDRERDAFDLMSEPEGFATDRDVLERRRQGIASLVEAGKTAIDEVEALRASIDGQVESD